MPHEPASRAVLSEAECLRLLTEATFGRVVYTDNALPAVTPVNYAVSYAVEGATVVFRTSPGSRLARGTDHAIVAFEVDHIDETHRTGWTVVVTGLAEGVRDGGTLDRLKQLGLVSWAGGDRSHFVRIAATAVTGRRLVRADGEGDA